jgi:hypothetical protein
MRLLNTEENNSLDSIFILLKRQEAIELIGALENLLESSDGFEHVHVNDEAYAHEITVALYDGDNLSRLDPRFIRLIQEDT